MEIVQQASLETGTRYTPSKPSKGSIIPSIVGFRAGEFARSSHDSERYRHDFILAGMHEYCIAIETEETTPSRRVMDSILGLISVECFLAIFEIYNMIFVSYLKRFVQSDSTNYQITGPLPSVRGNICSGAKK
eukprot:1328402-Amorphochlora_amoeboformis.AAC.2